MTHPRGTAGNGAVTLIDRLGPGEAPAGAVHAARSRSERSDVYSMWQTQNRPGRGRARATKSRDGAEAPERFKEGRHPRSAIPEPTPITRPTHTGAERAEDLRSSWEEATSLGTARAFS